MPKGHPVPYALTRHLVNRLTVPNVRYGWPAELGGRCARPRCASAGAAVALVAKGSGPEPEACAPVLAKSGRAGTTTGIT